MCSSLGSGFLFIVFAQDWISFWVWDIKVCYRSILDDRMYKLNSLHGIKFEHYYIWCKHKQHNRTNGIYVFHFQYKILYPSNRLSQIQENERSYLGNLEAWVHESSFKLSVYDNRIPIKIDSRRTMGWSKLIGEETICSSLHRQIFHLQWSFWIAWLNQILR